MKTIYSFSTCDDESGEVGGMFDEDFAMLDCWMLDDACWRGEYFNGFMQKLGLDVKPLPKNKHDNAVKAIRENFGL